MRAAGGKVRLVKINIDEHPGVAGQLGVRSIPAVYAFDEGRPVDGFMGAVPESQIKMFVDRLAGAVSAEAIEPLLEQAAESLKLGDLGGAAQSTPRRCKSTQRAPRRLRAWRARCCRRAIPTRRAPCWR
ncbi:MAG: thioredoxin domain-containing protein [Hyphomonadaceae bacterium]